MKDLNEWNKIKVFDCKKDEKVKKINSECFEKILKHKKLRKDKKK